MTALDLVILALALVVIIFLHQSPWIIFLVATVVLLLLKLLVGSNMITALNRKRTP